MSAVVNTPPSLLLISTGGTIAGWAEGAQTHYRAGVVDADALLAQAGMAAGVLQVDALAQIDSKDADGAFWLRLLQRVQAALDNAQVSGVVITHGTDTLEESAFFLALLLGSAPLSKPVVLTCAMRPASHPQADGPANLRAACALARLPQAAHYGVLLMCAGQVWSGLTLEKQRSDVLAPFISRAPWGALGRMAEAERSYTMQWSQDAQAVQLGRAAYLQAVTPPPAEALRAWLQSAPAQWPQVELVASHAGNTGALVDAYVQCTNTPAPRGLVVAGTGHGTLHAALEASLLRAQQAGVRVARASRCQGAVLAAEPEPFTVYPQLSPVQARIALLLELLQRAA